MYFNELSWDSNFFGYKIGKIIYDLHTPDELDILLSKLKTEGFKLIYLLCTENRFIPDFLVSKYNCSLIDRKIKYHKNCEAKFSDCRNLLPNDDIERLYYLAIEAGKYSRYNIDPKIGKYNYERLYHTWIDNSISGKIADDVFVFEEKCMIDGFITAKYNETKTVIGLIAVSQQNRGKGIGSRLVAKVELEAYNRGCKSIEVVTQTSNTAACKFYARLGMMKKRLTNIYHVWL